MHNATVITISNNKGGVGKSTSTLNIGAGLNKLGRRVLLIDLDPQANLSQSLGFNNQPYTIYGALKGDYPLFAYSVMEGFDIIPSCLDLTAAEMELAGETGREYILRDLIEPEVKKYDFILIDTPPSLGLLSINAMTASNEVLIPLQAEYFATEGLMKLLDVIEKIKKRINKELKIGGIFITLYDKRKVLHQSVIFEARKRFEGLVMEFIIRDNIALAESPAKRLDIFRYAPNSHGATDYMLLCNEILSTNTKL